MCRGIGGSGFFLSYPAVFFYPEAFPLPVYVPPKRPILPEKLAFFELSDAAQRRSRAVGLKIRREYPTEILVPMMQTRSF